MNFNNIENTVNIDLQQEIELKNKKEKIIIQKYTTSTIIICLLLIFAAIISNVLLGQVIDWFDNNTKDDSPGKTVSILLFIIDSIIIIYYTLFIIQIINQMNEIPTSNTFNYSICPIVFIYILKWIPRIILYMDIVSYMKEEKYKSLSSFDTILFEFIFGVVFHIICHIIHFISIILFLRKISIYRIRNNSNSICNAIKYC